MGFGISIVTGLQVFFSRVFHLVGVLLFNCVLKVNPLLKYGSTLNFTLYTTSTPSAMVVYPLNPAKFHQSGKGSKMQNLIDYRVRITMSDGRQLTGLLMAFDRFMNVVLADTEEFRRIKRRSTTKAQDSDSIEQEEKRTLGLIILRGEQVVSISVDAPPASEGVGRFASIQPGVGVSKPVGRGLPLAPNVSSAPSGLSGPVRGVGAGFGRGFAPGPPPGMPPPPQGTSKPYYHQLTASGFAPPGFQQ